MKRRGNIITLIAIAAVFMLTPVLSSCGSLHSYWGVENDYYTDLDGHHHYRPPKPPKHKKYKHKKHKKHHHHHDDDD